MLSASLIYFFFVIATCILLTSFQHHVSAVTNYRQREFYLHDEANLANDYHRIVFQEALGGTNYSLCLSASSSSTQKNTIVNMLCQAAGFTGIFTSSYQTTTTDAVNFPTRMEISSCDSDSQELYNFEDQCTFTTSTSCTPIAINCTGTRNGGEYGTYVPGATNPMYIRMTYDRLFQHRHPFEYKWWSQCDEYVYSGTTTRFLCSALDGFRTVRTGSVTYNTVESTDEFEWRNLNCGSNARSFDDCTTITSRSDIQSVCSVSEALGIYCSQHQVGVVSGGYRWRLYQTTNDFSPIEVITASTSTSGNWGRVCDDRFTFSSANDNFLCRLLGFPGSNAGWTATSSFTYSANTFLLDSINCQDSYTSFSQCSKSTSPSCFASEAVNLRCPYRQNNVTLAVNPVYSGNIYLRLTNASRVVQASFTNTQSSDWQGLCDSSMSYVTASRIGYFLGLGDRCSWNDVYLPRGGSFIYDSVKCNENAANFQACTKSTSFCSASGKSAVSLPKCWNQTTGVDLGSYFLRISSDGKNRLEIRSQESSSWGQIYFSSYSSTTALNLCRMFGFSGSSYYMGRATGGSGNVVMSNLQCTSSVKKDFIDMCTFTTTNLNSYSAGDSDTFLTCGTMDNSGGSSGRNDDDDEDDGALVGIIMGSVWGGIIFFVIVGSIAAACCDSSGCDCDCKCCSSCDDEDCCCAGFCAICCGSSATAAASGVSAETRRRQDEERREREESERLQRERERNERRDERRRQRFNNNNSGDGASSSSSEDDSIGDRRCPICFKVLKSETGRNTHMRDKHPGSEIPAHGQGNSSYGFGIASAIPTVPTGYAYPPVAPTMHLHEYVNNNNNVNYSDNVAPPPGGYSFGIPMQPINNSPYPSIPPPPGADNNQNNIAMGIPPPMFGPSPFIPGYSAPPQNGMYYGGASPLTYPTYNNNNNNSDPSQPNRAAPQ